MNDLRKVLRQSSRKYPLEYDECCDFVDGLDDAGLVYVHIPNEGRRSPVTGSRLRRIGLHSGFSDYLVFASASLRVKLEVPGIAVEMKRIKGSTIEPEQLVWKDRMLLLGWDHIFGFGAQDAFEKMRERGWPV